LEDRDDDDEDEVFKGLDTPYITRVIAHFRKPLIILCLGQM